MKVQLKNEMTLTTRTSSVKFAAKEQVTLSRTGSNDLLIEDAQHNKVLVTDQGIFKAVMENCTYGTSTKGRAKIALGKLCEEVDPELVADFMAATDQVPNTEAEKGCEDHKDAEEGGLDKLEIEVPVTMTKDTSIEDKIDVLTEEDEAVVDADLADVEAQSVELVDDAPAFTKDTQEDPEGDDVVEAGNDPDTDEPTTTPSGEGEEFFEPDSVQMKEEVELAISPDGTINVSQAGAAEPTEPVGEEGEPTEPDLGAAGVEAPVVDPETAPTAETEPVITEQEDETVPPEGEDKDSEENKAVEDPTEDAAN